MSVKCQKQTSRINRYMEGGSEWRGPDPERSKRPLFHEHDPTVIEAQGHD